MVSNKLNITFHVVLSQSSHHVMHLWHHHQSIVTSVGSTERKQSKWDRESMCENHLFIAMYGFIILAPKLTSHACTLRVCSPPAAIAVTQAISQTLICKALRIDSPLIAQMNKQRHKTWSFCLKYYILSMSNKIQRQVGGIFHLWQFLLDQIAHGRWPGIKKWRHVNKWKPWSFQLHCAVKPYFSVTKWKMHLLNTW